MIDDKLIDVAFRVMDFDLKEEYIVDRNEMMELQKDARRIINYVLKEGIRHHNIAPIYKAE